VCPMTQDTIASQSARTTARRGATGAKASAPARSRTRGPAQSRTGTARLRANGPQPVSMPTPAERAAAGKAARSRVPRESHAAFDPPASRPDPISLLERQGQARVPELLPVRYGRMLASPFAYFRGAALPMASDLATTPTTGLEVQACGDAHLSNFGIFASPERRLVFDINDFDETLPGPWEWDVKRLVASMEVAARDNGFSDKERRRISVATGASYRQNMRHLAGLGNLDVWYAHADVEDLQRAISARMSARQRKLVRKGIAKARSRDNLQAFSKLTEVEDGRVRIAADPPLVVPVTDLYPDEAAQTEMLDMLTRLVTQYRRSLLPSSRDLLNQFRFVDMARKVVGVGSVGTRCWIILMLGRDHTDPLFLQVKEAEESVLCAYVGHRSAYATEGERVVMGQRVIQQASDIFLGWQRAQGFDGKQHDFYVRQLRDGKFSLDIGTMVPSGMQMYGELCGATLARAHARTGDRIALASYLGKAPAFENAVADFASAYADQNERDYAALAAAEASGKIAAERDL
jgi:uncharacterized protein (DUF2252 family)